MCHCPFPFVISKEAAQTMFIKGCAEAQLGAAGTRVYEITGNSKQPASPAVWLHYWVGLGTLTEITHRTE